MSSAWHSPLGPRVTSMMNALRLALVSATHLDPAATYVRPDGQIVGTGQQLIDTDT